MVLAHTNDVDQESRQQPVYWYVVLEKAIERGDLGRAAEAQQELRRLGRAVDVRLIPPRGSQS